MNLDDIGAVLAAGASRQQIEDALAMCFTFNVVDRLSRAFGFVVSSPGPSKPGPGFSSRVAIGDGRTLD